MDPTTNSEDELRTDHSRGRKYMRTPDRQDSLDEDEREDQLQPDRRQKHYPTIGIKNPPMESYEKLPIKEIIHISDALSSKKPEPRAGRRQRRKMKRQRKKARLKEDTSRGEDGILMYEMEEGGMKEGSITAESSESEASFEVDRRALRSMQEAKTRRRMSWKIWFSIHILIATGFAILVYFTWKLSGQRIVIKEKQTLWNNGTALFGPTTVVISLDGFRADFLNRGLTPRLNAFIKEGVSPVYMTPSFPSVTFPNHYTLVTGLYPESHGIVGNTFWDPEMQQEFLYTKPSAMQPKWWGGEPIWVTAEKQGIRSAIHMWPGSEAHILAVEPSFVDRFDGKEALPKKISRIFDLLDKPGFEDRGVDVNDMRPQFVASYVPNVDSDGHSFGPNSTEIMSTISNVDAMIELIFQGLEQRNLTEIVNVIVVSDHGMATTDNRRLIQLEDVIDMDLIEHTDGWPLYGLRPYNTSNIQQLYEKLAAEAVTNPGFDVYLRDVNMPERYHFSMNNRIAPLWVVPKTGWAIVTKEDFDVGKAKQSGEVYHPRGLHGYDHDHPLMRAIFVARGPAFPHEPNSRVEIFQNTEVYNIICDSLALTPQPNNGTLRLPFRPIGLHTPEAWPEEVSDPEASTNTEADAGDQIISISPIEASSAADPHVLPPHLVGVDPVENQDEAGTVDRPVVDDKKRIWDWVADEVKKLKDLLGMEGEETAE